MTGQLLESAEADIAYVKQSFLPMDESSRALVQRRILPQALPFGRVLHKGPDGVADAGDRGVEAGRQH